MNKLYKSYGRLTRISEFAIQATSINSLRLDINNYISLRSCSYSLINSPYDSVLGASLPWIERHSDTCITSNNGVISTDTDTLLCIFANAYVCPSTFSIVIDNSIVVAESHHTYDVMEWISSRNNLLSSSQVGYFSFSVSPSTINTPAFIINTKWSSSNYYHWTCEALPRLAFFLGHQKLLSFPVKLVWLGAADTLKAFHIESLLMLGINVSDILFADFHCVFTKLIHLTFVDPGLISSFQGKILRDSIVSTPFKNPPASPSKPRILVLRKKSIARHIVVTKELLSLVDKYQLIPTVLEHLTVAQQINLFAHSELIVAPHGAGLSNLVFAKGSAVIEIMPSDSVHPLYMQIASSSNCSYSMYVVKPTTSSHQQLVVDPLLLENLIESHLKDLAL